MKAKKLYLPTPLIQSHPLSRHVNKSIYLKCELLQPSGSFKDRGIGNLCLYYAKQKVAGFVSSSGGNAGMAVAFAAQVLNIPATIVVPITTPAMVIQKLQAENATVIIEGENWDAADMKAKAIAKSNHWGYVPPFDHPLIWQGYRSLVEELQSENIKPDAIILSVGGGGLYAGVAQGLSAIGWQDVALITAETVGSASMAHAVKAKQRIRLEKIDTIAVTLGAKQICQQAFDLSQTHPTFPQIVTDHEAINACVQFANDHRLLVEPACGASLAVIYEKKSILASFDHIVVIVCGGSGVDLHLLAQWQATLGSTPSHSL